MMFSSEDPVVLLITVTQIEAKAVFEAFGQEAPKRVNIGPRIYYDLDTIGGKRVLMTQSEMGAEGPGGALITIHTAIEDLRPEAVILVGIAFGTNPQKEKVGDILVSRQIMAYETGKIGRKFLPRGVRVPASSRLLGMFRSGELDWDGPEVRFGLVLSGEKLINNLSFRNRLLELEPEAIGGEMEGSGLYVAAHEAKVDWIMVKAICDWADGNKNDDAQKQAAHNAAEFTRYVLGLGGYRSKADAKDPMSVKSLREEPIRLDVAAPEKVRLDIAFEFAVRVSQPDSPPLKESELKNVKSRSGKIFRSPDQEIIDYRVEIIAPDCKPSTLEHTFMLSLHQDSDVVFFLLTAQRTGMIPIVVNAFQENNWLAAQTRIQIFVEMIGEPFEEPSDSEWISKAYDILTNFDDVELDTFCLKHFAVVYDKFSSGMRRDAKITLLLAHCRKTPERRQKLFTLLRAFYA